MLFFSPSTDFESDVYTVGSTFRPSQLHHQVAGSERTSSAAVASTFDSINASQSAVLARHLASLNGSLPACESKSSQGEGLGAPAAGRREAKTAAKTSDRSPTLRRSTSQQVREKSFLTWHSIGIILGLLVVEFSDWFLSSAISYGNGPAWRILDVAGFEETSDGELRPTALEEDCRFWFPD